MEHLGDVGLVETCFSLFGDSVDFGGNRCMVCAERTIGSEILGDVGLVESCFGPFGDIVSVGTR